MLWFDIHHSVPAFHDTSRNKSSWQFVGDRCRRLNSVMVTLIPAHRTGKFATSGERRRAERSPEKPEADYLLRDDEPVGPAIFF